MEDAGTRYAVTADGIHIAYQVRGVGSVDLVWIWGFTSCFEVKLEHRGWARLIGDLAARWRVVLFDKRGTGLSDRKQTPDLEMRADDLRAVLDAVGSESAVLVGFAEGAALAAFFAASHPDRVLALVTVSGWARIAWAPDYPEGLTREVFEADTSAIADGWGTVDYARAWAEVEMPSLAGDDEYLRWFAREMRYAASPAAALEFQHIWYETDVRAILPAVQVPTLVLLRKEANRPPAKGGDDAAAIQDYLATQIPAATVVELPGRDVSPIVGDPTPMVEAIDRFLSQVHDEQADLERVLATVLFTDIVGSTERAAEIGDRAWQDLMERHNRVVRSLLGRFRGNEVDTAGDGFFATFDGPGRAIRCAHAILAAMGPLRLELRAGVHTGEVERAGDTVRGLAVHIGARVGATAGPCEVLVSSTVRDLVVGSELQFTDLGSRRLKGVPGEWHLYRAEPPRG